jgi:hypothetical protein
VLRVVDLPQFENEEEEDEDEYFENTDDALYDLPIGGEDAAVVSCGQCSAVCAVCGALLAVGVTLQAYCSS